MPNEFIARNGLIALNNTTVTGSFNVTGSTTLTGDITITGTAGISGVQWIRQYNAQYNFLGGNTGIGFIGVAPSAVLHITGASTANLLRIESPGSSSIVFVSGSGNVGIGTNIPASTLTINGNTRLVTPTQGGFFAYDAPAAGSFIWSLTRFTSVNSNDLNISVLNGFAVRTGTSTPVNTGHQFYINTSGNVGIGTTSPTARIHTVGAGTTSATTNFLLQNSTPSTLLTILDNGQYTYSGPLLTLASSQSAYVISQSISSSNAVGGQVYGVNITPTFYQTTASQTETAFRVAATFNTSSVLATGGTNIIADFGASSVGSQLTVTDVTSGSIYMVNDVSGLPIIEATSDWTVNMYNFPNLVFQKTGSQVNINGTLRVSGSFILPLSQSVSPQTGSAYWSGSLLFVYDGTRYRSSSFA